jgi:hypothetical protein
LSDSGKLEKPEPQAIPKAPEPEQGQVASSPVVSSELQYRASGGMSGTPPLQRILGNRQAVGASVMQRMAVMRKVGGAADVGTSAQPKIPEGSGQPLGGDVRSRMEPKLGADLSGVRVHTGGDSAAAAKGFGARAFTVGNDVHFNAGQFAPGSREGDKLLAHELTHVVQGQKTGIQRSPDPDAKEAKGGDAKGDAAGGDAAGGDAKVSKPGEAAEVEADDVSEKVAAGLHDAKGGAKGEKKDKEKDKDKDKKKKKGPGADAGGEAKDAGGEDQKEAKQEEAQGKAEVDQQAKQADAGAQGGEKKEDGAAKVDEKPAPISAKLEGVGLKVFLASGPGPAPITPPPGPATPPKPPHVAEVEAEFAKVTPVATLDAYNAMIQGLQHLVTPESKASVNLRVTKLNAAIARTKPKLLASGPDGPKKVQDFIDSRLPAAHAKPGPEFLGKAKEARDKLVAAPAVSKALQADAAKPVVNYGICAPEESASDKTIDDSGGIMKVYDVGNLYWQMAAPFQAAWKKLFNDDAPNKFTDACKSQKKLVLAPPGEENKPPFKGASVTQIYDKVLNGFVGQGKDAAAVGNFADAITRFALNPGYYPSKAMFAIFASAAEVKDKKNKNEIKIGKPSIFNLLNFDENVYDENDRAFGHLADPADPTKAGKALELTCQGYPADIWASAKFLG